MTALPSSIDDAQTLLSDQDYVCGRALATVVFLALKLGRPRRSPRHWPQGWGGG